MAADQSAAQILAGALSAAGVGAIYGRPLSNLPFISVGDATVAVLLAHAHHSVVGTIAVAHVGEGVFVVPGASPGGGPSPDLPSERVDIDDVADLGGLVPKLAGAATGRGVRLHIEIDLASRVPEGSRALVPAGPGGVEGAEHDLLELAEAAGDAALTVVLAGPGVVARDAVGGLRALAAAGRLGVLNTWGAKGVFPWQSRHHWATVGLQERDFELGGLPRCDLVLVTGLDEREAPRRLWASFPHKVVAPELLGPLAELWPWPKDGAFAPMPALRERLAAVTQAGWGMTTVPLMPTLVTRHYALVFGNGGLVASDPGTAGYWIARTFTTTRLGSASVPAAPLRGWAAACVLVSRLMAPLRPALAVLDGPVDESTKAVLAEAARLGVGLGIETWQDDGEALAPDEHLARLQQLAGPDTKVATLRTDHRQLDDMVEAAGPVRAWTGDEGRVTHLE